LETRPEKLESWRHRLRASTLGGLLKQIKEAMKRTALVIRKRAPRRQPAAEPVRCVLTVNGGSSSIKFALYRADAPTVRLLSGKIERIGLPNPTLTIRDGASKTAPRIIAASNGCSCLPNE
jgi:Acetokinase family